MILHFLAVIVISLIVGKIIYNLIKNKSVKRIILLIFFILTFAGICFVLGGCNVRNADVNRTIQADEAVKQTDLLKNQVYQLKRIADALQKDTVHANPFIHNFK
jgi:uncharacterized protein with PQ loop repeat